MNAAAFINLVKSAITSDFIKTQKTGGVIEHCESIPNGKSYTFVLKVTARAVVISLDVVGKEPFGALSPSSAGLTARCDLIAIVVAKDVPLKPLCFVIEVKSGNITGAQRQLEAGASFVRYLFELLAVETPNIAQPCVMGVLASKLPRPGMGTTKPAQLKFEEVGLRKMFRASWDASLPLSLSALVASAVKDGHV